MSQVAIVGAGITGLSLAWHLPKNVQITLFDKSRRAGGRVCTRTTREKPGYSFDHGLAFVAAREGLAGYLSQIGATREHTLRWCESWKDRLNTQNKKIYSGNPTVESIATSLLEELKREKTQTVCEFDTRITGLVEDHNSQIRMISSENKEYGPFSYVYVCIPLPQCRTLKQEILSIPEPAEGEYCCQWVLMAAVGPEEPLAHKLGGFDVCEKLGGNIGKVISQNWKGLKTEDSLWVFHMSEGWSQQHQESTKEEVEAHFKQEISLITGQQANFTYLKSHRWLYATPKNTPAGVLVGRSLAMGADWVGAGSDLEHSWNVGKQLSTLFLQKGSL